MNMNELYELAFVVRKEKLWKTLYDNELFAISLSNGEIGYCSVMGSLGQLLALALYVGGKGLASYQTFQGTNPEGLNQLKLQEFMLSQSCLQCSFEGKETLAPHELKAVRVYAATHKVTIRGANAFPQFVSYQPAHHPWSVSMEEDINLLGEMLAASLEVSKKLKKVDKAELGFAEGPAYNRSIPLLTPTDEGFFWSMYKLPPKRPTVYPEPKLEDELLLARLRKQKKKSGTWACDVIMSPTPSMPEDGQVPIYPYMLLAANCNTKLVIPTDVVEDYEKGAETLLDALGNRMLEMGIPNRILVTNNRTYALLKSITSGLNVELKRQKTNSFLDALEEDLLDYCGGAAEGDEDDASGILDFLDMFDSGRLQAVPEELWQQLQALVQQGLLDEEIESRVRELLKRRNQF